MIRCHSTEKEIRDFIAAHPIHTGGSISVYNAPVKEIEDGDSYIQVRLPLWPMNNSVVRDVLKFLTDAHEEGADIYVRGAGAFDAHRPVFVVNFYMGCWSGDS